MSIGHLLSVQFEFLGPHLYRSTIFLSVCVKFELGLHLYRSVIHLVSSIFRTTLILIGHLPCQFELSLSFQDRTYIDMSFPCQFNLSFLGPHLYRSVIVLSVRVWGYTYIDRSSHCLIGSVSRTAPISINHRLNSQSLGSHLYQSTISLSCQFNFWDRTYIDRSSSYQLEFGATPISIGHLIVMSVQFLFLGPHLYQSVIFMSVPCQFSSQDCTYIDRSFILSV